MNGKNLLIDTNILIYLLDGDKTVESWLDQRNLFISSITQVELYSFQSFNTDEIKTLNNLLNFLTVIHTTDQIIWNAIEMRKKFNLRLPDAIIAGTAKAFNYPFLTADLDFKKVKDLELYIYDYKN